MKTDTMKPVYQFLMWLCTAASTGTFVFMWDMHGTMSVLSDHDKDRIKPQDFSVEQQKINDFEIKIIDHNGRITKLEDAQRVKTP